MDRYGQIFPSHCSAHDDELPCPSSMVHRLPFVSGYTLLEVMVALIIIGISLTAVTGGLGSSKRLSAKADQAVDAVRILNNLFNDTKFVKDIIKEEEYDDMLPMEEGWHCRVEVEPLNVKIIEDVMGRAPLSNGDGGEEIEVPGMVAVKVCLKNNDSIIEKEYCITRWEISGR